MRSFFPVQSLVALAALSLGLAVLRSQVPQQAEAPAAGKPYEVDTKASRVYVKVDPDGGGHGHGIAGQLATGTVTLGASRKAGELVFDLTSFDADAPEARKYVGLGGTMSASDRRSVTRTMLGGKVLNTAQYAKAAY